MLRQWGKRFWSSVGERAAKTFVQVAVALWIAAGVDIGNVDQVLNVGEGAIIAGLGAGLSVITSWLSGWAGNNGTPSALPASLDPASGPPGT